MDAYRSTMTITLDETLHFAEKFFATVASGGDQDSFFLHSHARIYVLQGGETIGLEDHKKLHSQWTHERHLLGQFALTTLSTKPERIRATGTVYWEASYRGRPEPNTIKAVVGEDWIIERIASGALRFVLYMNTFHQLLPDSAPLQLE